MKRYIVKNLKRLAAWIVDRYYTPSETAELLSNAVGPLTYKQDGLYTVHNCDFMQEPLFSEAYQLGKATGSWGGSEVHWRAYIACLVAERSSRLEGDFVECGVNRGGLSRAVIHYTNFSGLNKTFHLLDTFQGLDGRYITEEEKAQGIQSGGYSECYSATVETFRGLPVNIIRGPVPDTLVNLEDIRVAYLSIDMNCVLPEVAAAEFFWDKLVPGATILLDDYGWPGHITQKRGFDCFAASRGTKVLALPTGQGIIVK